MIIGTRNKPVLSFNYTDTRERLYGKDFDRILSLQGQDYNINSIDKNIYKKIIETGLC